MADKALDSVGVAFFYQSELGCHPDIDIAILTPSIRVDGCKHDRDRVRHIDHSSRFSELRRRRLFARLGDEVAGRIGTDGFGMRFR